MNNYEQEHMQFIIYSGQLKEIDEYKKSLQKIFGDTGDITISFTQLQSGELKIELKSSLVDKSIDLTNLK